MGEVEGEGAGGDHLVRPSEEEGLQLWLFPPGDRAGGEEEGAEGRHGAEEGAGGLALGEGIEPEGGGEGGEEGRKAGELLPVAERAENRDMGGELAEAGVGAEGHPEEDGGTEQEGARDAGAGGADGRQREEGGAAVDRARPWDGREGVACVDPVHLGARARGEGAGEVRHQELQEPQRVEVPPRGGGGLDRGGAGGGGDPGEGGEDEGGRGEEARERGEKAAP